MARSAPVRCTGFIARIGTATLPTDAMDALAQAIVARTLGPDWSDEPVTRDRRTRVFRRRDETPVPFATAWPTVRRLRADRDVASAELELFQPGLEPAHIPDFTAHPAIASAFGAGGSSGVNPKRDWSLSLCHVQDAWELPLSSGKPFGEGILIGHPDTGYTRHPEIVRAHGGVRADLACDFVRAADEAVDPLDQGALEFPGHGTGTASVIIGDRINHPGVSDVTGVAPEASLVPLRVSRSVIHLNFSRLVAAIDYATDIGCHVISMSLGGPFHSDELERVVQRAINEGIIVFAAAGNYWPFVVYPAKLPEVIAVAACNAEEKIWRFSACGPEVDVTAPGESVWTARSRRDATHPFGEEPSSGTSHATATMAGVCALWLARHGRDSLIQRYGRHNLAAVFKELLITHGVRKPESIDWASGDFGAGLVDANALLSAPLPATAPAGNIVSFAAAPPTDRPSGVVGEIARLLPSVAPDRLRTRLRKVLDASEAEFPGLLREHGEELVLLAAFDPATRRALGETKTQAVAFAASAVSKRKATPTDALGKGLVSRALRRRLTGASSAPRRR